MSAPRHHERSGEPFDLPVAPRFCRAAQLTDRGLALGEGVVVAPLTRQADGAAVLAIEGGKRQFSSC